MIKMRFKDLSVFWKRLIITLTATAILLFGGLLVYIWSTLGSLIKVML